MVLYPDPAHLCLRGWYSSLGGKSVYIYYATEAQPILFFSNRCDSSRGLLVFLAEKKKCQTITRWNKWSKKNAFDYGVRVGSFFYKTRVCECEREMIYQTSSGRVGPLSRLEAGISV